MNDMEVERGRGIKIPLKRSVANAIACGQNCVCLGISERCNNRVRCKWQTNFKTNQNGKNKVPKEAKCRKTSSQSHFNCEQIEKQGKKSQQAKEKRTNPGQEQEKHRRQTHLLIKSHSYQRMKNPEHQSIASRSMFDNLLPQSRRSWMKLRKPGRRRQIRKTDPKTAGELRQTTRQDLSERGWKEAKGCLDLYCRLSWVEAGGNRERLRWVPQGSQG